MLLVKNGSLKMASKVLVLLGDYATAAAAGAATLGSQVQLNETHLSLQLYRVPRKVVWMSFCSQGNLT